jgi:HAD superfamily hydrolase (TIGR01509 family)
VAPPHWRSDLSAFAAVIFDMDGVLVDGEPLHFQAVNELLGEEGRAITLEQYKPYMGTKSGWRELIRDFGLSQSYEYYHARYPGLMLQRYRDLSEPLPGAVALVRSLRATRMPLAVASSSIAPWVEACLSRIGLADVFDVVITGSDVTVGKPAPDIYLLAAERLGVSPAACLAVEDAPAGIASAKAAAMTCWAVRTEYTRGLDLGHPDREFDTLEAVSLEDILGVPA